METAEINSHISYSRSQKGLCRGALTQNGGKQKGKFGKYLNKNGWNFLYFNQAFVLKNEQRTIFMMPLTPLSLN